MMLEIKNLSVSSDDIEQISNVNLTIKPGETQALIGPKFSGKSCLAYSIIGHPALNVAKGSINFNKKKLNSMPTMHRSKLGIFLSKQHKTYINNIDHLILIKECLKARNDTRTETEIEKEYLTLSHELLVANLYADESVRLDLLLMAMLKPSVIILDQIDEQVFKPHLKSLAKFIIEHTEHSSKLIIPNSSTFLNHFDLSCVSVMVDGEIKQSGSLDTFEGIIENGNTQFP